MTLFFPPCPFQKRLELQESKLFQKGWDPRKRPVYRDYDAQGLANRYKVLSYCLLDCTRMGSLPKESKTAGADIFIAGSGPVGCTFARTILDRAEAAGKRIHIYMADVGSIDGPHVIDAALQKVSVAGKENRYSPYYNPNQKEALNVPDCAMTRTIGGMGTHWTCACPRPEPGERTESPLSKGEFDSLLKKAEDLLQVRDDQYDDQIRHIKVKKHLEESYDFKGRIRDLPLAVKRDENHCVTFGGPNTILGKWAEPANCCTDPDCKKNCLFSLRAEHKVIKLKCRRMSNFSYANEAVLLNLRNNELVTVVFNACVIALGAIGTPQLLLNSDGIEADTIPSLGRHLSEQSLWTCQVWLYRSGTLLLFPFTRKEDDHEMVEDMKRAASVLGEIIDPSEPKQQGTTRIGRGGKDCEQHSVADENSLVHNWTNLYVGGNGVIPDATACNPTLTSVAYAIKSAEFIASTH
ncbi:GMC oxidoreductase domain-containing protein [Rhizoctonia solani AG-1 IA]|uniref:GMC oxidoreductase domain-containing protein n=1 Tax=Thanatephorus cucumeris (strain AG1-IA) TaxID=983506 RepID=L8WLF2_THACA|nr:GMC oxidoreductase domain-containing protein [Rhizoctonia solani AG-1 IA]